MREHQEGGPLVIIERHGGGAGAFLWGALLGAGAALLLAPRSGAQTQAEIRERAFRLRNTAEDRVNSARNAVTDAVDRTRDRVRDQVSSVREMVETRTDQARQAVEAGLRAAQDARSELERRVADAKDAVSAGADALRAGAPPAAEVDVVIVEVGTDDSPDVFGER
jgi:gas vesicle protein